ncbi:hypothetical protein IFM89_023938 [Coptis chinensis]|uniref:Isopropylmalate dehydrogenase-like domain-containing protein n=1 Tax=Coptis chinensis TaxID=261450 RepID=A0A835I5V1_9MAGN|nr:hypothetical protein IFM89_023938 [Coptis chinensis]
MLTGSIPFFLGPGLFEPIHGSILDIAGQDKTTSLVTGLNAAIRLRYGLHEENAARIIESVVLETLNKGFRMGDIFSAGKDIELLSKSDPKQEEQMMPMFYK